MAEILENKEWLEKTERSAELDAMNRKIDAYKEGYQQAEQEAKNDMAEYYKQKKLLLEQEAEDLRQKIQLDRIERSGAPRYAGVYKYKSEWEHAAADEFIKNGESSYYKYCREQVKKFSEE